MRIRLEADVVVRILIEGGQSTTEASLAYVGLLSTLSSARTRFPEEVMRPGGFDRCDSVSCEIF